MRKQAVLLVVVLLSLTSCDSWFGDTNSRPGQTETLTGTLTGKWQVVAARAGDEDITDLYQGYVIEFTRDGGYTIVNPTGSAPNPNRNNESDFGFWTANTDNSITLDQAILMQILGGLSQERIQFQWDVTVLGKGTVTYHWDIVPL